MSARCVLCGGEHHRVLFEGRDWLHGQPVEAKMLQCNGCGLIYLWPQPARVLESYPDDYAPHVGQSDSAGIAFSTGYQGGLLRKARLVAQFPSGPLLDLGCGAGEFLAVAGSLADRPLWGMDISQQALKRARQQFDLDVWSGDAPGLPLADGSVGVVTLWHVLEHLAKPQAALNDIARVLQPQGVLVLACPMVDSWEARLFGRYWAGYDVPRHLFSFSRQTLSQMLGRAGFEAVEIPRIVWGYSSAKISSVLWLRRFSVVQKSARLLRWMASLMGGSLALGFDLLSRLVDNHRAVAVFVANKQAGTR
jgi:SAM-dependent methyltransferase